MLTFTSQNFRDSQKPTERKNQGFRRLVLATPSPKNSNEIMAVSLTPQGFEVAPDEPILIYKKGNHLEGENVLTNVLTPALHYTMWGNIPTINY